MRLEGKKAIITGSSRGVGAALAQAFAREGADSDYITGHLICVDGGYGLT